MKNQQENIRQFSNYDVSGWSYIPPLFSHDAQFDQNYRDYIDKLKNDAEQGYIDAQLRLATFYFKGDGVPQNAMEAIKWLEKAAECGSFEAQIRLANCYLYGKGVDQDYAQAVKWLEKAVAYDMSNCSPHIHINTEKKQLTEAQYKLGICYLQGYGVNKNSVVGMEWLKKAAEQGHQLAQIELADCYFGGIGVKKDDIQAVKWLEKAAGLLEQPNAGIHGGSDMIYFSNEGHPLAQRKLGFYYLKEKNYTEAIKYLKEYAKEPQTSPIGKDKELGRAQAELGLCYYYAQHVDSAFEAFEKASKQDDCFGHLWLAFLTYRKNGPQAEKITGIDRVRASGIPSVSWNPSPGELEKFNQTRTVQINENKIAVSLNQAALFFFLDGGDSYPDLDIINYLFPDEVIRFLEGDVGAPAKLILGFCYSYKNDKEKSLKFFHSADEKEDIIASYKLGENCKNSGCFDKANEYFEKVEKFKISLSDEEKYNSIGQYEKNIKQWLVLLAKDGRRDIERIKKNQEIEEKNKCLEDIKHRMQRLVEQFTHSLGNVIFPDTIYQVAERLKNNPECRKDVLLLHEAYHSEIIIKLQGELLRQRYANTSPEKFRQFIRSCRRTPNSAENTKSIEDILDYAASRVTARFLNQHYAGLNSIRDKMLSKKNQSLDALKQKFEDDILLNKSLCPIAWINQNLRPVQITEISPLWKKVFILSESHAEALLFGYFSEILFNAFKYADHDKDKFLTLVFGEKTINDKTYLTCIWENPVKDKSPSMLGTGKGLDAIQEDLKQLNDTENPEESLLISQQKNQFQVTLFFKKDLLVNDLPSLKIKRKANVE